jgi:hypothetical protein
MVRSSKVPGTSCSTNRTRRADRAGK